MFNVRSHPGRSQEKCRRWSPELQESGFHPPRAKRPEGAKKARSRKETQNAYQDKKTLQPPAGSPFKTIPQFGFDLFGLSRNGSYEAADRGDFDPYGELVNIGRRRFVRVKI